MTDEMFVKASRIKKQISHLYDLETAVDHMEQITITGKSKDFTTVELDPNIVKDMCIVLKKFASEERSRWKEEFDNL